VRAKTKIRQVYSEYCKILRVAKTNYKSKKVVNSKKIYGKQLFDITSCKCLAECICSCDTVVCNDARLFLEDQRTKRYKIIGLKYLRTEPEQILDNMNLKNFKTWFNVFI
jgi:hypothetical protein